MTHASPRIDKLARAYVCSRALQSPALIRRFDQATGAHLHLQLPYGSTLTQSGDLDRFFRFAERALWEDAPVAVRSQITHLVEQALSLAHA